MIIQTEWTERKFNFDFPSGLFPNIIERLRGTPVRVEELIKDVPDEALTARIENKWSIQEHIGHLISVEALWEHRLDQYRQQVELLIAADMTNQATERADYNSQPLGEVLRRWRIARFAFVQRLEETPIEIVEQVALHPRLNTAMRLVDLCYFAAEHDDHHLARMAALIRQLR
ncbi:MAG: DinB family protein [bacterium]